MTMSAALNFSLIALWSSVRAASLSANDVIGVAEYDLAAWRSVEPDLR